jgi:NADPH:quinone reductase-like Zn-dependent oxidoreductase
MGESVVRVAAAGAGHFDLAVARGEFEPRPPLPYTPGTDGAGEVVASEHYRLGTWVRVGGGGLGLRRDGTWAEFAVAPDDVLQPIPVGVDPPVAASFYVPASAAYFAVHEVGRLRRGERVAVIGASGAVGSLAVQLARLGGASEVVGVVSRPEKAEAVVSATSVAVGRGEQVVPQLRQDGTGVDLLVDTVGGPGLSELVPALAGGGRIVVVGYTAGRETCFDLPTLLDADVSLLPVNLFRRPARAREAATLVLEMMRDGSVSLPVTTFSLDDLSSALAALSKGSTIGRVVLLP